MDRLESSGELINNIYQRAGGWTTRHLVKAFYFDDVLDIFNFERRVCAARGSGVLPRKNLTVLQGNVKWKFPVKFEITKFCR